MNRPKLEPRELIQLMAMPNSDGVYVLGSFEKRVTVYSQQVRAINLIHALLETGDMAKNADVAIIGAGAAGLTAAAALVETSHANVTLLEQEDRVLALQRACTHRWLHPHLYDWPEAGSFEVDARLPFLTWRADTAANVAGQLVDHWIALKKRHDVRLREVFNVTNVRIGDATAAGTTVEWQDDDGPRKENFRVVILAVGYGKEPNAGFHGSYWAGDDLEHPDARRQKWMVAGCGDGGLTDILRLLIHDSAKFEQLAWLVGDATDHPDCQALLKAETFRSREKVHAAYDKLVEPVAARIHGNLRKTNVTLNGLGAHPFGSRASVLNRFLVSQLVHLKRVRYKSDAAEVVGGPAPVDVRFSDGTTERFDRVLRRFGPESAIQKDFPRIWMAFEVQRKSWEQYPFLLDRSRIPIWPDAEPKTVGAASSRPTSMQTGEDGHLHGAPPVDRASDEHITATVDGTVYVPADGTPLRIVLRIQALNNTRRNLAFRDHEYSLSLTKASSVRALDAYGDLSTRHSKGRLAVGFPDRPPIPAGGSYGWTLEFVASGTLNYADGVISGPYKIAPQHEFLGVPVLLHTFWYDFVFSKPVDDPLAFSKEYRVIQSNNRGLRPTIAQRRHYTLCSFSQFQLGGEELRIHFSCIYERSKYTSTLLRAVGLNV